MKITVIAEVLGEPNNGTTIAGLNLINYLKQKGHDVKVVCPDKDKEGEEGYYILPNKGHGKILDKMFEINQVVVPTYDENVIIEACKDADCVHILEPLFIAKRASKLIIEKLHKPVTAGFHAQSQNLTAHINMLNNKLVNKLTYRWYDDNVFCRADGIHYPTQFIKDYFEKTVKRKTNGYVISNGVNNTFKPIKVEKPSLYKDKFCILFTGRLSKEKSHMVLLKAVTLSKYADKIQLFFAGQGPMKNKIEKYSQKHLKNQPVIKFYSREELLTLINMMDLYCHPSLAEIEAISCLEAIACGIVPLIANSPHCATKNFALDERSLFKVGDSLDLAKKIDYFIEHPDEVALLKNKYLDESVKYDQTACMEQMEQMFVDVIGKKRERENEQQAL